MFQSLGAHKNPKAKRAAGYKVRYLLEMIIIIQNMKLNNVMFS